jgi:hypothetical protein
MLKMSLVTLTPGGGGPEDNNTKEIVDIENIKIRYLFRTDEKKKSDEMIIIGYDGLKMETQKN